MGFSCKSRRAAAVSKCAYRHSNVTNNSVEVFRYKDLDAATNSFAQKNLVQTTSHGALFRAHLPDGRIVAVKRPHDDNNAAMFRTEAQILSKLFSRRLVNLLGYCNRDTRTFLVVEHMERGTLQENVQGLDWPSRVSLAVDVAKAMRALHASSPRIVHCNLRSANVFLDQDGHARLGDFCLAKCSIHSLESIPEGGHPGAAAADPKIDVFSFGVLLLELISGRTVDQHQRLIDWAIQLVKQGQHMALCDPRITVPPVPDAVGILANVAVRCVRPASARRPSMDDVVQSLTRVPTKLVVPNLTDSSQKSLVSTPVKLIDSPPLVLKKKKRALVFRLSRFLARKLRIRSISSFTKMHRTWKRGKLVADDHGGPAAKLQVLQHEQLIHRKMEVRRSVPGPAGSTAAGRRSTTCSRKKFVRLT